MPYHSIAKRELDVLLRLDMRRAGQLGKHFTMRARNTQSRKHQKAGVHAVSLLLLISQSIWFDEQDTFPQFTLRPISGMTVAECALSTHV